jgi:hypothetical protein
MCTSRSDTPSGGTRTNMKTFQACRRCLNGQSSTVALTFGSEDTGTAAGVRSEESMLFKGLPVLLEPNNMSRQVSRTIIRGHEVAGRVAYA